MKNLKSLLLGALLATSLIFAPAKKAEAGIVLAGTGFLVGAMADDPATIFGFTVIGGSLVTGSMWLMTKFQNPWMKVGGTILIVLDTDRANDQPQFAEIFSKTFPFIDNAEVIENLAIKVAHQVPANLTDKVTISLSEDEIREALAGADLTEEQVEFVVNNLK